MNTSNATELPLLKAVGFCALLAGPAFGQMPDNVSQGQEYSYSGGRYEGLSSDVVINQALDTPFALSGTVSQASQFLTDMTSFAAWKDFIQPHGFVGVSGGANVLLPNLFSNRSVLFPGNKQDPYLAYRMGPFYVDQVYGGAGVLYNDVQGTPPGVNPVSTSDDSWSSIVWLNTRFTTYITDRFALSVNPWVYYLPLKGDVGWAAGQGLFGLTDQITPQSSAKMGLHIPVGRWDFSFFDQFQAFYIQDSILGENFFISADAYDLTPVDPAGRFHFGGFGPSSVDMTGDTRLTSNGQLFRSDRLFFRNNGFFQAFTKLGEGTSFSATYGRFDFWDDDMDHLGSWDTASVMLARTMGNFRPFVAYQGTTQDQWNSSDHWILTGAAFRVNPQLIGYGNLGYLWASSAEQPRDQDSWLGMFGLRQQIGPYTSHSLEAGRSVTDPEFNARTRSDYVSYMLSQVFGPRLNASLFFTYADRMYLGSQRVGRDHKVTAVGAVATSILSTKSSVSVYTAFEKMQMDEFNRAWDLWTYRMSYFRHLGHSANLHLMYQYQHASSDANPIDNYSEHLIYAGVMKQF